LALSRSIRHDKLTGGEFTAAGEYYLTMPDGLRLFYNFSDPDATRGDGQSLEFLASYRASPLESFVLDSVTGGCTYIDVGANSGYYYALKVARHCPDANIFAFEPDRRILPHLARNIAINRIDNITIVPMALCDEAGTRTMTAALGASNHLILRDANSRAGDVIDVACDTLDNFLRTRGLSDIAFIKVDIEGAEYAFLLGAADCIRRQKPILLLELSAPLLERSGSSVAAVLRLLVGWDYKCFRVRDSSDALAFSTAGMDRFPAGGNAWLSEMPSP
jgi:FkbM family methyltransferase